MSARLTIALDAMGGDHAPEMVVAGADMARLRCPEIDYLFFGDEQRIKPLLANLPDLLLADEVTGQLDSENADQVMDIIFDAWRRRGLTVLFVTHNGELAARAERRLVLEAGEVRDL